VRCFDGALEPTTRIGCRAALGLRKHVGDLARGRIDEKHLVLEEFEDHYEDALKEPAEEKAGWGEDRSP
jgi:hypothetical protein